MMYDTHVYLGPSLDLKTAKQLFPKANYHPPIQCGDILQLLRLHPKKIIIIDGLYEVVPAVWHKEILIAIQLGIEVWGASSMGALRAAELYQYGMKGYGDVYHDFKTKKLTDDDEVAVLHRGEEENYYSINDAMVNIRATCELAFTQGVLTLPQKNDVIDYCKAQFYPYRSLQGCVKKLGIDHFAVWLDKHGIVDVKKQDAIGVLKHNNNLTISEIANDTTIQSHLTIFIRELISSVDVTPLRVTADWLPTMEKNLQRLHHSMPQQYMLVAELAYFSKKLYVAAVGGESEEDLDALLAYIKKNQLLSPDLIFSYCRNFPKFQTVHYQICKVICDKKLTEAHIERYLPVIAHYYELDEQFATKNACILRVLLILILSTSAIVYRTSLMISDNAVINHCQELKRRRKYTQEKFQNWFHPKHFNHKLFMNFMVHYFVTLRGTFHRRQGVTVYPWIYDAYAFYEKRVEAEGVL